MNECVYLHVSMSVRSKKANKQRIKQVIVVRINIIELRHSMFGCILTTLHLFIHATSTIGVMH
jgi:hypothetical protein